MKVLDSPLVSIIIPIYNAAPNLGICIESVKKQTYTNLEILLVNDGSSDTSLPICEMFARTDRRMIVVDKENEGVSATRNLAIELAKGKYIQFVDADDHLALNATELMVNRLESTGCDMVICHYYRQKEDHIKA